MLAFVVGIEQERAVDAREIRVRAVAVEVNDVIRPPVSLGLLQRPRKLLERRRTQDVELDAIQVRGGECLQDAASYGAERDIVVATGPTNHKQDANRILTRRQ